MPEESPPQTASSRRSSTEAEQQYSRQYFRRPDDGLLAPSGTASRSSLSNNRSHRRSSSPGLASQVSLTRSHFLSHNSNKNAALASMEKEMAGKSVRQTMSTTNTTKPKPTQKEELPSATAAMRNRQQDLEAKRNHAAVAVAGPGAAAATTTTTTNFASNEQASLSGKGSGATRPGAVAVSNTAHSAQDEQAMLLAGMLDDTIKKSAAMGGSSAAAATTSPGAVAVAGSSNEQAVLGAMSDDAIKKRAAMGNAPAAVTPGAVAVAGPSGGRGDGELVSLSGMAADDAAKKRAGRHHKSKENVMPGAVAVGGVNSNDEETVLAGMQDNALKRKLKNGAPAVASGVVSSSSTEEEVLMTSMMEDEAMIIKKGSRGEPALAPGAEPVRGLNDNPAQENEYNLSAEGLTGAEAANWDYSAENNPKSEGDLLDSGNNNAVTAESGRYAEPNYQAGVHAPPTSHEGLAVAVAIEEEEANYVLPAAVEYDPDAKPPFYKNRRFRLYGALGGLLLIGIIVGVVVGVVVGNDDGPKTLAPTATPSNAPTTAGVGEIQERFVALAGEDVLIEGTPANKAATWIVEEDPMNLDADAENLEQRFLLAYFYYSTTQGDSEWRACGKPEEGDTANCTYDELTFDFNPDDGSDIEFYTQVPRIRWLSGESECSWVGSFCDTVDTVRALELWGNNITGTLPAMLATFPFLQSISLAHNQFTGTIPEEYTGMRHLNNLELNFNSLTGTISPNFYKANALQNFNVGANMLDGPVSSTANLSLANLEELKGYHIFDNALTGKFPTEIGALNFLSFTRVGRNDFDQQPIPTQLGQLTLLQEMWFDGNSFTSTIPTEIALVEALTDLRLNNNQLSGPIPEALYELAFLELLFIEKNKLTGTLSTSIGRLVNLEQIRLRENQLTGTIPTELGRLFALQLAWLHRNEFTGPIPEEVCDNVGCDTLRFLNADCGPLDNPGQICTCCTACCERDSVAEICLVTNLLSC